jgi:hypothetical protein
VVSTETLHLMPKPDSRAALDSLRGATKPGGLNAVSGYLVEPNTANRVNNARCFHPGELHGSYEATGWRVIHYNEDYQPIQYIGPNQAEHIFSKAEIIAKKQM